MSSLLIPGGFRGLLPNANIFCSDLVGSILEAIRDRGACIDAANALGSHFIADVTATYTAADCSGCFASPDNGGPRSVHFCDLSLIHI